MAEYNPSLPDKGTLDLDVWERIKENILKANRKDEHLLVQFWITWALFQVVRLSINGVNAKDLEQDTENS